MPVITMTLAVNQATEEQKSVFIDEITSKASEIISLPPETFTILIHETSEENVGIGGKTLKEVKTNLN